MSAKDLRSLQEAYYACVGDHSDLQRNSSEGGKIKVSITDSSVYNIIESAWARTFHSKGDVEELHEVDTKETREGTKYKVRVKDRQSGSSYIRFATREKIAELRANPNISSVELTDATPSNATADGTTGKTQTFGGSPNFNNSSGPEYQRPVKTMSNRPSMAQRMNQRDQKATRM